VLENQILGILESYETSSFNKVKRESDNASRFHKFTCIYPANRKSNLVKYLSGLPKLTSTLPIAKVSLSRIEIKSLTNRSVHEGGLVSIIEISQHDHVSVKQ